MSSEMSEQVRQHYLSQLGVTLWYSRLELPGAAASPDFNFEREPSLFGSSETELVAPSSTDGRVSEVKSAASILSELAVQPQPIKPETELQSEAQDLNERRDKEAKPKDHPPAIPDDTPPLNAITQAQRPTYAASSLDTLELTLFVGRGSWFLADNGAEFPEVLKQKLLLNIAGALGENINEGRSLNFSWPFFGNNQLPGNDAASMIQLLLGWLDQQVVSNNLNGFLMGGKLSGLLLDRDLSACAGKKLDLNLSDERGVAVMPLLSLNDLLREPKLKQTVWQQIKPYR